MDQLYTDYFFNSSVLPNFDLRTRRHSLSNEAFVLSRNITESHMIPGRKVQNVLPIENNVKESSLVHY